MGSVLVGVEMSRTWTMQPSSLRLCVLGNLGVFVVKSRVAGPKAGRLMRRERADANAGELVRALGCWHTATPQSNLVLLVYLPFS